MEEHQETVQEVQTAKGNSMNPLVIVAVLAVVFIGGGIFMMNKNTTETAPSSPEPTTAAAVEGTTQTATETADTAVQTVSVEAGAFYYKPAEIRVKKGQKVTIVMNSVDMMHDFIIDELNVKMPITKSGETNTVEFTADTAGTFEYYCSVGEHRQKGQVGKLIVEE